jgi:hypothetical protein
VDCPNTNNNYNSSKNSISPQQWMACMYYEKTPEGFFLPLSTQTPQSPHLQGKVQDTIVYCWPLTLWADICTIWKYSLRNYPTGYCWLTLWADICTFGVRLIEKLHQTFSNHTCFVWGEGKGKGWFRCLMHGNKTIVCPIFWGQPKLHFPHDLPFPNVRMHLAFFHWWNLVQKWN